MPQITFLKYFICRHAHIFILFSNEPELGAEIDPGMVMTHFHHWIRDSNSQPNDRELNLLSTRPD